MCMCGEGGGSSIKAFLWRERAWVRAWRPSNLRGTVGETEGCRRKSTQRAPKCKSPERGEARQGKARQQLASCREGSERASERAREGRKEEAGGGAEGGAEQDSPFSLVCRLARTRRKVWGKRSRAGAKKSINRIKSRRGREKRVRLDSHSGPTPAPPSQPQPRPQAQAQARACPPRPEQPINKPTSSLPPAPLLRRPLRALGIAAGGCSHGTP